MKELLSIKKVGVTYLTLDSETVAVKDLNFNVQEGEFVSVIGPSGCGKSTILSLIAGLIEPTCGVVERGEKGYGYMLQKDELFPWRTIEKNVFLPLEIKRALTEENKKYCHDLLDKYGLKDFKKSYPSELSGGMRQRVALIRTLALKPNLLLLDEPFSALDYQTRLSVCDDVYDIIRRENKTAILVTHDISEAISMSDRIIVLTKRPATVKKIHVLDTDKEKSPLKRREEKNFTKWFDLLWRELNDEKE